MEISEATNIEVAANGGGSLKDTDFQAPGTIILEGYHGTNSEHQTLLLHPQPTADPNDPLNWPRGRKALNFGIATFFTLMIFALIDIGPVVWQDFNRELHISYPELNDQYAVNTAFLGIGSVVLIPLALKYGRRPIYILSASVTLITAIWQAALRNLGNMLAAQVFNGLACAVAWTLVPITITDLYFVHQRGRANAIYQLMSNIGVFLGPVLAGYIANSQGWPWIFWWCAIFLGINLLFFLFFFEETKYVPYNSFAQQRQRPAAIGQEIEAGNLSHQSATAPENSYEMQSSAHRIDRSIPLRTYREKMALISKDTVPQGQYLQLLYRPFQIVVTIPAVAYVAVQYSAALVWFVVIATTQAQYLALPPYNFGTTGIGLLNLPPLIGSILGCLWGGPLSDWSIKLFAHRNNGVYEPEMRLYISVVPGLLGPAGVLLYGYSVSKGLPWIFVCLGSGIYGFSMAALIPIALAYLTDSYHKIIGNALTGVNFVQYMCATVIVFALNPWISSMGLYNFFTLIGCLALACNLTCIPMIMFGKRWRMACKSQYERMATFQLDEREA